MNPENPGDMNYQEEMQEAMEQLQGTSSVDNSELLACQEQVAYWKDQTARQLADFENYKKRMDREQIQWMQTAQTMVIKDLLTVVDNFDRALSQKTESTADLYAGVEMIYKSVLQLLQKYGVQEFTEYNEFDPEKHEALMDVESSNHTSGQIVQVLEKGFTMKDKVIRPAKVSLAK